MGPSLNLGHRLSVRIALAVNHDASVGTRGALGFRSAGHIRQVGWGAAPPQARTPEAVSLYRPLHSCMYACGFSTGATYKRLLAPLLDSLQVHLARMPAFKSTRVA